MTVEMRYISISGWLTIVSTTPSEHFSLIGHSEHMGGTAGHLDQLVAQQGLHYLGLETDNVRGERGSHPENISQPSFLFNSTLHFSVKHSLQAITSSHP